MVAKFHHELHFAHSLGLFINKYRFLKQKYSQLVRATRSSECMWVLNNYAAFLLFKFQQEEITGVLDANVLFLSSNFILLITNLL